MQTRIEQYEKLQTWSQFVSFFKTISVDDDNDDDDDNNSSQQLKRSTDKSKYLEYCDLGNQIKSASIR